MKIIKLHLTLIDSIIIYMFLKQCEPYILLFIYWWSVGNLAQNLEPCTCSPLVMLICQQAHNQGSSYPRAIVPFTLYLRRFMQCCESSRYLLHWIPSDACGFLSMLTY